MKPRLSILMSMLLGLLFLFFVVGEPRAQAGFLTSDNQIQLASNRSGSLWIEVTPDQMYIGDCNGKLSYGGGVGAYRLWVHDSIKLTQVPGQYLYNFCATVGGDYAFQVWDGSGNTVSARVNVRPRSDQPPPTADTFLQFPEASTRPGGAPPLPSSDGPSAIYSFGRSSL